MADSKVWPGIDEELAKAFLAVGQGVNINTLPQVRARRATYYHRQLYPTAGTTQLQFFSNATNSVAGVTNMPQQGFFPNQQPFWFTGLTVQMQQNCTIAGARVGSTAAQASATIADPVATTEEIRTIMQAAFITLKVGDYTVIDAQGLDTFPQAGGMTAIGASFTGTSALITGNGEASADNMYQVKPWYPILPQKIIQCYVTWNTALSTTGANANTLKLTMHGIQVTPSNL